MLKKGVHGPLKNEKKTFSIFFNVELQFPRKKFRKKKIWKKKYFENVSHLKIRKIKYFLLCNKKIRVDFADELKVGDVRCKHLTQITIKVQLFWRLAYEV